MPPPSILIAGCGYVGRALAGRLHAENRPVTGLTRSPGSAARLDQETPFRILACDISNADDTARLSESICPDIVIHCAASGRGGGADAYRAVYADGARHLAATFPGARLIFTSSTSVYPQTDGSTVTERSPAEPSTETGRILRIAERVVLEKDGAVLRLAGIYGPGRSIHLRRFLEGAATIETGPVSRFLNQIHREDIVSAICHVIDRPVSEVAGEIFNVADEDSLTQRSCYELLSARFGRPLPPEAPPGPRGARAQTHKRVSSAKLRRTGWQLRYPRYADALENDPDFIPSIQALVENRS